MGSVFTTRCQRTKSVSCRPLRNASSMCETMTTNAEPHDIKLEHVTAMVMPLWLALMTAFRTAIRANQNSFFNGAPNSQACPVSFWTKLALLSSKFSSSFWMEFAPLLCAFSYGIGIAFVRVPISKIFLGVRRILFEFFRILPTPVYLPLAAFFAVAGTPAT